jgi:putative heme-binding domain-containing protein
LTNPPHIACIAYNAPTVTQWLLAVSVLLWGTAQALIGNPVDPGAGKLLFEGHCAVCHGMNGGGGRGPNLNRPQLAHAPDDAALKSVITDGIPLDMPSSWFLSDEDIANLAAYVRSLGKIAPEALPGDSRRGAGVYAERACATCHIVAGEGSGYGPELTDVGIRRSAAFIRQTVLDPASTLPEQFLFVEAIPVSGPAVRGVRANEDTFTIQVKDPAGQFHSFRKQDLRELRKLRGQTPMPSFRGRLKEVELDDLVAYLAGLRGGT